MARQKHSQVAQEIFQAFANGCANGSITDVQATMREVLGMAVEQMLKGELDAHLGYSKSSQGEKQTADRRNGYSCKTIKTNLGETVIDVPRDRDGSFEPKERSLPFGLKYKLVTDYNSLATVAAEYEVKRREIIKKYGTENEETHEYSIQDEESKNKASEEILELLKESVIIEVLKVPTKEIESVGDESIEVSSLDILLIQTYLVEKEGN